MLSNKNDTSSKFNISWHNYFNSYNTMGKNHLIKKRHAIKNNLRLMRDQSVCIFSIIIFLIHLMNQVIYLCLFDQFLTIMTVHIMSYVVPYFH